jgi:threonyl-tRNA synthetase
LKVLPISDKFLDYAKEVEQTLVQQGIRVEIDDRQEKIGKKIRDTELMKIPYMLIVGEKEMNDKLISVRRQGKGDVGSFALVEWTAQIKQEIENRQSVD